MKKAVIFHPAIAPYRIDFFNSLNDSFNALFFFESQNALEQNFDQEKLIQQLSFKPHYLKSGFLKIKNLRLDVIRILVKEKPEIVFISEYNILGLLVLLYKFIFDKNLKIATICDDNVQMAQSVNFKKYITRKVLLKNLYAVILTNKQTVDCYIKKFGNISRFVYFPIVQSEVLFRQRLNQALLLSNSLYTQYDLSEKKIILYVGRLNQVKNIPTLINAFKLITEKRQDVHLFIVGDGDQKDDLVKQVIDLDIKKLVSIVGKKEGFELLAFYNIGNVFVLPSTYEPFGAVVNEALIAGCRVVCSEVAGAASLINQHNGSLFAPEDHILLSEKIDYELNKIKQDSVRLKDSLMQTSYTIYYSDLIQKINL